MKAEEIALNAVAQMFTESTNDTDFEGRGTLQSGLNQIALRTVKALREAGLLLEWRPNNPETAETLAEIYGSVPVNVTYVKDGKIKEVFEVCAVDAHLYSPFGASHLAIIQPPEQTNEN